MKCKKCNNLFYHKKVFNFYCSVQCSGVVIAAIKKDGLDWKEMWRNFWIRYYLLSPESKQAYFESMLQLMPEKYINNKGKNKYILFKPNNIQL